MAENSNSQSNDTPISDNDKIPSDEYYIDGVVNKVLKTSGVKLPKKEEDTPVEKQSKFVSFTLVFSNGPDEGVIEFLMKVERVKLISNTPDEEMSTIMQKHLRREALS